MKNWFTCIRQKLSGIAAKKNPTSGTKHGEFGPFRTRALAVRQARAIVNTVPAGMKVTVEPRTTSIVGGVGSGSGGAVTNPKRRRNPKTRDERIAPFDAARKALVAELGVTLWKHPRRVFIAIKPSTATEYGQLGIVEESAPVPAGWELLTSQAVPTDRTLEQIGMWLDPMLRRAPLLPYGKENPRRGKIKVRKATKRKATKVRKLNPFRVSKTDVDVIMAFLNERAGSSHHLSTDGKRLDGNWMGGTGIARHGGAPFGQGIDMPDLGSKAANAVQNKITKIIKARQGGTLGEYLKATKPPKKNPTKRDRAEFASYLAACTDAQVRGVYEKEQAAGRRGYAAMAKAEMARRERRNPKRTKRKAARKPSAYLGFVKSTLPGLIKKGVPAKQAMSKVAAEWRKIKAKGA